ncbi:MAG: AMP-binding protein [Candidatus Pacearchaeota archaeon]|jgi:acetyl-CoA synthetase
MNIWKKAEKDIVMHGDKMNIVESCVDRHAGKTPAKVALLFLDEYENLKEISYGELESEINKFANYLNKLKVKKNSRVFIFLPKIPEMYISFLGIIKQGSIAAPLFEAFQADGLELRLTKGDADVLITNKELLQRLKHKPKNMEIIVIDSQEYESEIKKMSADFSAEIKNKKDTAIMIFTSSTAGTPVAGVEIPHYGLVQQHFTGKLVLDLKENDKYWCTAHPGWVTGSVYGIISPLSIGCSVYVFEGHFDSKKWLDFIVKNKISVIYTAPTALRMLKSEVKKSDFASVRNICSVGEALTDAIFNYYKEIGIEINDTYWQTETGAIVIANYSGLKKKPGSMGKTIPGIKAKIKDDMIVLKPDWPAMMTGIYKHDKMYKSYFKAGLFLTNDRATVDRQGYFFFKGRKDDIIKTSGERVSPIEIESILLKHKSVKEVAIIGIPDVVKGEVIKAFIVLEEDIAERKELEEELKLFVKENYAGHAYPKIIEFVKTLPKTHSGKIVRMELRKNG